MEPPSKRRRIDKRIKGEKKVPEKPVQEVPEELRPRTRSMTKSDHAENESVKEQLVMIQFKDTEGSDVGNEIQMDSKIATAGILN
jgi:hypothetical protein